MNVTNNQIARQAAASCLFLVANATRVFVSVYYFCAMEKFEFVVSRRACCIRHMDFYNERTTGADFQGQSMMDSLLRLSPSCVVIVHVTVLCLEKEPCALSLRSLEHCLRSGCLKAHARARVLLSGTRLARPESGDLTILCVTQLSSLERYGCRDMST